MARRISGNMVETATLWYIKTKGRHTRVLCSSVVRHSQRLWICAPPADWVSDGVVPYTWEGPRDCQGLLSRSEDPVHCRRLHHILAKIGEGIVIRCTFFPIMFVKGMGWWQERETGLSRMDWRIYQPPTIGFMDELKVKTTTHIQARWALSALEDSISCARIKFKAKKSRCLVMRKGFLDWRVKMQIQGEEIPSIVGNPIKCLGKWFN